MATADRQHILYLDGPDTVHQKLVALKNRLAPTDRARKLGIARRDRELRRPPPKGQTERWLQQWERVYAEAEKVSLADIQDNQPLYDVPQLPSQR